MPVAVTSVQNRTLRELVDVGEGATFPPALEARLRDRVEQGIEGFVPSKPVRLWKERLNDRARCEGLFAAEMAGERAPFRYDERSARGTLVHKAIELEIGSSSPVDLHALAERAASRLEEDRQFGPFWDRLDQLGRDELLMGAVERLESFRASFPSLGALRSSLAPVCEHWMEATFGGGRVAVVGKVDLVLNRPHPVRSTRVLLDLKTGRARPDHAEDMRLYALLYTLRYGIPPFRVATLFLNSGQPQAEVVTEEALIHAAGRVIEAVRTLARLRGHEAGLRPGPHCERCPRRPGCPAVTP